MAALQDTALDALQDLYLARDWDASPGLVRFLYSHDGRGAGMDAASAEMHAEHAFRLRRWAVAMVAWTLALAEQGLAHGRRIDEESCCGGVGGYREEEGDCHNGDSGRGKVPTLGTVREECSATDQHQLHRAASTASSCSVHDVFQRLFDEYPAFEGDYRRHVRKMSVLSGGSGNGNGTSGKGSHLGTVTGAGTIATKNPQLRLASNALRNGERSIGFRQCAFHGHRAEVGEGRCPNRVVVRSPWKMAAGSGSGGAFYDPFGSLGDGDEENDPGLAALLLSPEEDAFAFSVGSWKDDMGEGDVLGLGLGLGLGHGVSGNYGAGSFAMTDNSKLGHQSYSQQRLAPSTNRDVAPQKRTGLAVRSHIRSQSHY